MRHVWIHARAHTLQMLRTPYYWGASVMAPVLFFVIFGISNAHLLDTRYGLGSEYVITPFLLFSTLNVTLLSLAGGIAAERASPWEARLRLLPVPPVTRFLGRLLFVLGYTLAAWVPLLVLATVTTTIRLPLALWPVWIGAVLVGSLPFGLLGIALGYRLAPQSAAMVANIVFLLMSFAGGLFIPPDQLPPALASAAPFLPSHEYLQLVLTAIGRSDRIDAPTWTAALLVGWGLLFLLFADRSFRRDEGLRYG